MGPLSIPMVINQFRIESNSTPSLPPSAGPLVSFFLVKLQHPPVPVPPPSGKPFNNNRPRSAGLLPLPPSSAACLGIAARPRPLSPIPIHGVHRRRQRPPNPHNPLRPGLPYFPNQAPPTSPRRRCLCLCLLALLAALAITLLVLFLTVLKVRDPTTRLVSTQLSGIAPRLTFPAISIQLNVTLLLVVSVHNPNPASFSYPSGGHTDLTYRGVQVGEAQIDPGRIPSRGDGNVSLALTLQADRFGDDLAQLITDVESGAVTLEANTRIPGKVNVFGLFKKSAVAYSDCSFVFGIPEMKVRSQQCQDRTKL